MTNARQDANYAIGLEANGLRLQEIAAVQEDVVMSGNSNADKSKWTSKEKPKNSIFLTFADDKTDKKIGQECPLKDGTHPSWKCQKFLKMNSQARFKKAKELKVCFLLGWETCDETWEHIQGARSQML